ncbi:pilus assembly protein, partial [Acinetobacter nosocomialis]|uniref:fimbrial biogenesis chaperone n=2 Tax=Moraxellaceae TaxID=468 RepID=UPI000A3D4631
MKKVLHLLVQISLCVPTFVDAASIRLSPISLEMVDNQTASSLSIYNQSSESSNFQTRVFEWLQVDGKDQLIPTDDVVISPPVFKLPSDGSFNLRVVRVNATPVTDEKAYRIILDELPQPVDSRKVSQGVTVLLRSSLPLFVVNKNAFAQINWKIENSQNQPFLVLNNTGTRHALLSYLSIIDKTTNNSYPIPVNTVNGYILKKKMKSYAIGNNFKFQNNHQY